MLEPHVEACILAADAKAFATYSSEGVNVVPVSSIRVQDGAIWLIDYFMEKTRANVRVHERVALVCWKKMIGYQIKGRAAYLTDGPQFEEAVLWVRAMLPERVVKGLIIITPEEVYDIAPTKDTAQTFQAP